MNKLVATAGTLTAMLSHNLNTTATSFYISDASNFPSSGYLGLGLLDAREIVEYTSIEGNKIQGVTRAVTPKSFPLGTKITLLEWTPIVDKTATIATTDDLTNGSSSFTVITQDLGVGRSGTFDITGLSGLTANKPVTVIQTCDPIPSKGDATDEPEMDMIFAVGHTLDATSIRVMWHCSSIVAGEYNFGYLT